MDEYKRLEGETDDELIYRICSQKEKIGTWLEVAAILNTLTGNDYNESAYRKKYQTFRKMFEANQARFADSVAQLAEIQRERLALEKARVDARDERTEIRRIYREAARSDRMWDRIGEVLKDHEFPAINIPRKPTAKTEPAETTSMIIPIYDLHTGIKIKNAYNTYDKSVLHDRMSSYISQVLTIQSRHNATSAHIILSELLSGYIHPTLRIENEENVINQFLTAMDEICIALAAFLSVFTDVYVYCVPGNHSRMHSNKEEALKGENLDHLALPFIQTRFQNFDHIHIQKNTVDESIATFEVRNSQVYAVHGDKDTIKNCVSKLTMYTGVQPDIVYIGHYHTNALYTEAGTKVIRSGCFCGIDNYAADKRLASTPEQAVSVIDDNGLVCIYDCQLY